MADTGPSIYKGSWKRKAGGYDWERYINPEVVSPSVGHDRIGDVKVDCTMLFRESKWGVLQLGSNQHKAGIVYMELGFHQPVDCKLARATVRLTLDEKDPALKAFRGPAPSRSSSKCAVEITDFYGPRYIVGPPITADIKKSVRVEPNINVGGTGGSLGNFGIEKHFPNQSRWSFKSHREPGQTNILNWEMTEDDINKHPLGRNKVYTAFAYIHSGQPFLMKVEIFGKLYHIKDRFMEIFKKDFGARGSSKHMFVTLIQGYNGTRSRLKEQAEGLEYAMQMKNAQEVAVEIQQAATATFTSSAEPEQQTVGQIQGEEATPSPNVPQLSHFEQDRPQLPLEGVFSNTFLELRAPTSRELQELPLESLDSAGRHFTRPNVDHDPLGEDSDVAEGSTRSSSPTLVAGQSTRSKSREPESLEPIESEDYSGTAKSPKETEGSKQMVVSLTWENSTWILGLGFLVISMLYAHLLYQMREVSRGLR